MRPRDILNKLLQPIDISPTSPQKTEETSKFLNFLPLGSTGQPVESRLNIMSAKRLKRMSNTDPVIWSIKKTRKDQVTQQRWDIVPDLDEEFADLERWEQIAKRNLNQYGFKEEFKPAVLNAQVVKKVEAELSKIKREDEFEGKAQIQFLFEMIKRELKQEAGIHALQVKKLFNRPNNTQTSFSAFLKVIVDDILTFDAGTIVKNKNRAGTELVEMLTIPGQEVKLIKNDDGSTPEPPNPAYKYCPRTKPDGFDYTNDELVYIVDNPQHTGYGMSPLEVAVLIITASLYAEEYNLDFLKHSNIPPGILNLGANVPEEKRKVFQALWDAEIAGKGGLHKLMFAAGSDAMKLIPLKHLTNKDMQLMDYLKWTLSIKCMCYGVSPQDIGFTEDFHRTTSEVQKELSKTRGLKELLSLLESYINSEVVKVEWSFKDVKFKWLDVDLEDAMEQAKIDHMDIRNGVKSINERRKGIGEKPIEGGDEHYVYTGTGIGTSIEESYKQRQTQTESQAAGQQVQPQQPQQQGQQPQQQGKQTQQQNAQKVEKNQSDSCMVNTGVVLKTLEEYQELVKSLLDEEE